MYECEKYICVVVDAMYLFFDNIKHKSVRVQSHYAHSNKYICQEYYEYLSKYNNEALKHIPVLLSHTNTTHNMYLYLQKIEIYT